MGGCLCCIGDDDRIAERYINELNAYYGEACRLDPEIQAFNDTLQRQTSRVLSSLAKDAAAFRSPSLNSLGKATDALFVLNHDAVDAILYLKDDISSNPDLLFFVKEFFKNTVDILKFFDALKHCLRRAHEAESIVNSAVKFFDEREFSKSLEKLREFRALGDPFTSRFINEIQSVWEQEQSMLTSLLRRKHEIDGKIHCVKVWRKVWSIVYAVTFAALLISSVVLAAVAAPPVAVAAAQAASAPMEKVGEWFNTLWKNCVGVLEGEAKVIGTAKKKTSFAIHDLENISVAVEQLEVTMSSMVRESEFGTREEEEEVALRDEEEVAAALREAVEKMRKNMQEFGRGVVELEGEVDKCRENVREALTTMLEIITSEA